MASDRPVQIDWARLGDETAAELDRPLSPTPARETYGPDEAPF